MSERVTAAEARAIAQRFVDRHFRNDGKEGPRISIPAIPSHDDDLRLLAFIARADRIEAAVLAVLDAFGRDDVDGTPADSITWVDERDRVPARAAWLALRAALDEAPR